MTTYLVTGGAGFIGSNVVTALVERGHTVRVLDNFATGRPENLDHVRDSIRFIEGSITDPAILASAMDGVEVCLHQAALGSVPRSIADPLRSNHTNVTGSLSVYLAARDAGVRRVIAASSSSTYGPHAPVPTPETTPLAPVSPYATSKAAADMYARTCASIFNIDIVTLRYFNVFGPRQDPKSQYAAVIPRFITALLEGRAPEIHGDGSQSRDFSYVENVVQANIAASEVPGNISGVYNIACGDSTSVLELYRHISELLGVDIAPVHTPPRAGDISRSRADITKAEETFGYVPRVRVREGLERTVAWYLEKGGLAGASRR